MTEPVPMPSIAARPHSVSRKIGLRNDIGPRLVAMVRNIEAALGGAAPQSKKEETKS